MKNKVLIIQANYYKDISTALLKSAKNELVRLQFALEFPVVMRKCFPVLLQ